MQGLLRSRGADTRLTPPERDGCDRPRHEIRAAQVMLDASDAGLAHPLGPQQRPLGRIAEAARVLLTYNQREDVCRSLIEVHQKTVLGVQIDQRSCQPWDRRKIADGRKRYPHLPPGVGFERPIAAGVKQAGLPGDMLKGTSHHVTLARRRRGST